MLNNLDFCEKLQTQLRTLHRSDAYRSSPREMLDIFDNTWEHIPESAKKLFIDAVSSVLAHELPGIRAQAIEAYKKSLEKACGTANCCGDDGG